MATPLRAGPGRTASLGSLASVLSVGSIWSVVSVGSIASAASVGSIASLGSIGSIASVGRSGAVLNYPVAARLTGWAWAHSRRRVARTAPRPAALVEGRPAA